MCIRDRTSSGNQLLLLYGGVGHLSIDDAVSSRVHGPHRPADGVERDTEAHHDKEGDEKQSREVVRAIFS